jgi:outer membrane protein OmpA-like peptidoglycan-associated protein
VTTTTNRQRITLAVLTFSLLIPSGCASRRFVRDRISENDAKTVARINEVEKNTADKVGALDEKHQTDASRLDELAKSADSRAGQALQDAAKANDQAENAGRKADESARKADEAMTAAAAASSKIESLADLKLVASDSVLFAFDSAVLTEDETAKLDALAQKAAGQFHTIEVHGFTDSIGNKSYNLDLSQARAEAVARYLAQKHQIPLHRIQLLGFGSETVEVADDVKPRERNRLSRRVEIRVFAPEERDIRAGTL